MGSSRTCMCSPTTHPGSFRCIRHRNIPVARRGTCRVGSPSLSRWELAMVDKANAVKAILLQLIKPSSHDLQRRKNFRPKPSRFCLMNSNGSNGVAVS